MRRASIVAVNFSRRSTERAKPGNVVAKSLAQFSRAEILVLGITFARRREEGKDNSSKREYFSPGQERQRGASVELLG